MLPGDIFLIMSIISLTPEQHELLIKGGMERFFSPMTTEDMYEIIPLHAQEGYDDMDMYCYEREEREKCLNIASNIPVKSLDELFSNAEKIRVWLEGGE